jgi:hypothetical protein
MQSNPTWLVCSLKHHCFIAGMQYGTPLVLGWHTVVVSPICGWHAAWVSLACGCYAVWVSQVSEYFCWYTVWNSIGLLLVWSLSPTDLWLECNLGHSGLYLVCNIKPLWSVTSMRSETTLLYLWSAVGVPPICKWYAVSVPEVCCWHAV